MRRRRSGANDGGEAAGAGRHMTTYSEEAKATAAKVELILKVAKAAFVDAIDFLACIETLEAGNQPEIIQSLTAAKAGRTAELIQRALFGHCLTSVMTAFDPVRSGDFHLAVGMALVAQPIPRMALCGMKGTNLADIEAAERQWTVPEVGARVTSRSRQRRSVRCCSSENSAQPFGVAPLRSLSAVRGCIKLNLERIADTLKLNW